MNVFRPALGKINGGEVLDTATGRGGSVGILERNLKSYTKIAGIDNLRKTIIKAKKSKAEKPFILLKWMLNNLALWIRALILCSSPTLSTTYLM